MTGAAPAAAATLALGGCDEMRAEVLVQAHRVRDDVPVAIDGALTGPYRGRDTTLPATARLQPTATPGLARAILTEPAFWTPHLPNRYRLQATITSAAGPPVAVDRLVGLRRLGVRGRSLWLDGHRWVPRAVRAEGITGIDACKPPALAALVDEPDEETLARADEIGVAILATISKDATDAAAIAERIAAWSMHPSVAVVLLPDDLAAATSIDVGSVIRERKDTLLLAAAVSGADPPPEILPHGVDALVVALEADAVPHSSWREGARLPLIAWRRCPATPTMGRRPCDVLQAALASWATAGAHDTLPWDWAGYVVG